MKRLVLLFVVIAFVATSAMATVAEKGPAEIEMPAPLGDVSFSHVQHQSKVSDCTVCHHKGADKGKCTGCHGPSATEEVPKRKKAFHGQCKGCHKNSSGPTKCKGCHIKK